MHIVHYSSFWKYYNVQFVCLGILQFRQEMLYCLVCMFRHIIVPSGNIILFCLYVQAYYSYVWKCYIVLFVCSGILQLRLEMLYCLVCMFRHNLVPSGNIILLSFMCRHIIVPSGNILLSFMFRHIIVPSGNIGDKWHFCASCEAVSPPRAWHCTICNVCILKRQN